MFYGKCQWTWLPVIAQLFTCLWCFGFFPPRLRDSWKKITKIQLFSCEGATRCSGYSSEKIKQISSQKQKKKTTHPNTAKAEKSSTVWQDKCRGLKLQRDEAVSVVPHQEQSACVSSWAAGVAGRRGEAAASPLRRVNLPQRLQHPRADWHKRFPSCLRWKWLVFVL